MVYQVDENIDIIQEPQAQHMVQTDLIYMVLVLMLLVIIMNDDGRIIQDHLFNNLGRPPLLR